MLRGLRIGERQNQKHIILEKKLDGGGGISGSVHFKKKIKILFRVDGWKPNVLTTHRLAYLCCQCGASLDMKLAGREVEQ